jgi:hypothetical protein
MRLCHAFPASEHGGPHERHRSVHTRHRRPRTGVRCHRPNGMIGENFLYVFKAGLTARTALPVYGLPAYDRGRLTGEARDTREPRRQATPTGPRVGEGTAARERTQRAYGNQLARSRVVNAFGWAFVRLTLG